VTTYLGSIPSLHFQQLKGKRALIKHKLARAVEAYNNEVTSIQFHCNEQALQAAIATLDESDEETQDVYGNTVGRLEPDIAMIDAGAGWASVAISMKRIADELQQLTQTLRRMEHRQ
jgi:uncharacterized protein YlxP (DUF503 family)